MKLTTLGRLAVWTPELDSVNGQNLVTRRVVERQKESISQVYAYPTGGGVSIFVALFRSISLCVAALRKKHTGVYLICSRSMVGFFRDLLVLSLSLFKVSIIVHVHGSDFPKLFESRLTGRLARAVYRNCVVIVPSAHLLPQLEGIEFRSLRLCENFSDPPDFLDSKKARRKNSDIFSVLWNSNLMASKGFMELTEAIRVLNREGLGVKLIVLGSVIGDSDATKNEMLHFLASLKSESWIEIEGRVGPDEVAKFLESCDAVALPSTYKSECQPLAIVQAMLAARIVLVSPTEALRATVGTYPALFARRNPNSIADAFRPFIGANYHCEDRFNLEAKKARVRFSACRFDSQISEIFAQYLLENPNFSRQE